jgi:hypothetical protein
VTRHRKKAAPSILPYLLIAAALLILQPTTNQSDAQTINVPVQFNLSYGGGGGVSTKTSGLLSVVWSDQTISGATAKAVYAIQGQATLTGVTGGLSLRFDGVEKKTASFTVGSATLASITVTAAEIEAWDLGAYRSHTLTVASTGGTLTVTYPGGSTEQVSYASSSDSKTVTVTNPTVIVNSTIVLVESFDGGGKTYLRGPSLGNYPIFRLAGSGVTLENAVVDDGRFAGDGAAVVISGSGNSVKYCTLNNCVRYGFAAQSASGFYIGYNTVTMAQYGVSGSSGGGVAAWSRDGVIEFNVISGVSNCGVKCKAFERVLIRSNVIDLTPRLSSISPIGVHFSGDAGNLDVVVEDNTVKRSGVGAGGSTIGFHSDSGPSVAGGVASTRNVVRGNVCTGLTWGARLEGNNYAGYAPGLSKDYLVVDNVFVNTTYKYLYNAGLNNVVAPNVVS